jgi:hypothetical protein
LPFEEFANSENGRHQKNIKLVIIQKRKELFT